MRSSAEAIFTLGVIPVAVLCSCRNLTAHGQAHSQSIRPLEPLIGSNKLLVRVSGLITAKSRLSGPEITVLHGRPTGGRISKQFDEDINAGEVGCLRAFESASHASPRFTEGV